MASLCRGHVEPGESFVDAVIREMKEETGLTVIRPRLAGIKQFPIENGRYIVLLFKAEAFSGEVISSDEGKMEWIDVHRLSEIRCPFAGYKEVLWSIFRTVMEKTGVVVPDIGFGTGALASPNLIYQPVSYCAGFLALSK